MLGIPTVLITVDAESSGNMRPPRAICPEGFHLGHSLGSAGDIAGQMAVLRTALRQFEELHMPGQVQMLQFPGDHKPAGTGQ